MVKNERRLALTEEGAAEIDPALAFEQVVSAIDELLKRSAKVKGTVTHMAAAVFWHSLLGINAEGRPTTTVLSWADTRSRSQVPALRKKFDEPAVHDRTGARFHPSYWPAKLLWLRKEFPEQFRATARWISFSDYVLFRLTGELSTSVSMASATGIFDQRSCDWDPELQRSLMLRHSTLPPLAEDGQVFTLLPHFAKRWPRLSGTALSPAIGDGAANNIGTNCLTKNKVALMIGTSGAMRVAYRGEPPGRLPFGLWCYRIDRKRVLVGGAVSDGGGLFRWLIEKLRIQISGGELEREIKARKPTGHNLVFLPFLAGERSTGYHEKARGAVLGLTSVTDSIDITQAALESVAYRFADIFDQLNKVARIKEIIASGGALRESSAWTQIFADVLGRDIHLSSVHEASLRGAAIQVLGSGGALATIKSAIPDIRFKANPDAMMIHVEARKKHRLYYGKIINS